MEILISVAAKVAEYTVGPIGRQLGYLFFYSRNIKDLEEKLENLETTRNKVQTLASEARGNSYEINVDVSTWFDKVAVELPNMQQQNEGGSNRESSNPPCLNLVQRHQLSRKSTKKVKYILELIEKGDKFDKHNIGHPAPLPDTKSSTLPTDYQILKSRTLMAEKIKDALEDPNVNKVGVYGMGGIGKTKLLDEVKKLVLEKNLFDRVIDVTVGQSNGVIGIQDQIGDKLNMELNRKASKEGRASFLRNKLVEMKGNILIMLDDLWEEYELEKEVGILCRSESRKQGCKILMTSRSQNILTNKMNAEKCFEVTSLSEEESWKFFMEIVGEIDKNRIENIAKNVVKECGGLPIALKIIAEALKGKGVHHWKDALNQFANPVSVNIEGVIDKVYSSLKFSYDWLKIEARLLFLLCSVFPDDHHICVKDLQMYAMGMGFLNGINNWEDARNRVIKLVDDLKSSSLLLESNSGDDYVQMHDAVRDVAKYIASQEDKMSSLSYGQGQSEWQEKDKGGPYNAIFVDCSDFRNLPQDLEFPKLQLLILTRLFWTSAKATHIPDAFFEGMEGLRVLDMTEMCFEPSRTSLTHSLKNLQTLCMSNCECIDIYTIGQLKKLEILRINNCTIEELPATMSQLIQLKVLDVSYCSNLEVIPPNIISSMTKLEELSLWRSFTRWGEEVSSKHKLIKNVEVFELNHLTRLSNLRLEIGKVDDLSLERVRKLEEFCICVDDDDEDSKIILHWDGRTSDGYATTLMVNIKWQIVSIGGVLQILLERCEKLHVRNSVGFTEDLFKPDGNCYPLLKHLHVEANSDMPRRIDVQASFPELEHLTIRGGDNLEMLWHNNGSTGNFGCKLQNILIASCHKLKHVFPSNMVTSLIFLNTLKIIDCELLEGIFEIDLSTDDAKIVPLTTLTLDSLPNLRYVWNNDPGEFMTFPNLKKVYVSSCPLLKSLFPASFIKHIKATMESLSTDGVNEIFPEDEVSKLVLRDQIVLFSSLKTLAIPYILAMKERSFWLRLEAFPKLQSLTLIGSEDDDDMVTLPLEISKVVCRIEEFKKKNVIQLVHVFENGEEYNHIQRRANLKKLVLSDLPNLTHVWKDNTHMTTSFDNLEVIDVRRCENLKYSLPSSITFFNLVHLAVGDCNGMLNLFNSSVAKNLVNLEKIRISNCGGMSSIVAAEGEGETSEAIIFKKLKTLELDDLSRVASFYSGKCILKIPCLETLKIRECPEMTFPYGINRRPKLEKMRTSTGEGEIREDIEIVLPSLRNLEMGYKVVKRSFSLKSDLFLKLKDLTLFGSKDDDMITLPREVSHILYNIEFFTIHDAFQLIQIFPSEEKSNHIQERCANLKQLQLFDLPNLTHVWNDNTKMTTSFENLKCIFVQKCGNLKCLLPSSMSFLNLGCLTIQDCDGMMNLFSSSVAKNLVNLEQIRIYNCRGMSSIVTAEGEGEEENGEEIIFNKLFYLELYGLRRLTSFHSGKCALTFPCLKELLIKECPEMKIFSCGIISMPKLKYMRTGEGRVPVSSVENINVIIEDFCKDENVRSIQNLFTQQDEENSGEDSDDSFIYISNIQ